MTSFESHLRHKFVPLESGGAQHTSGKDKMLSWLTLASSGPVCCVVRLASSARSSRVLGTEHPPLLGISWFGIYNDM